MDEWLHPYISLVIDGSQPCWKLESPDSKIPDVHAMPHPSYQDFSESSHAQCFSKVLGDYSMQPRVWVILWVTRPVQLHLM